MSRARTYRIARLSLVGALVVGLWTGTAARPTFAAEPALRPRVIISTDLPPPLEVIPGLAARKTDPPEKCSDPDDVQSLVRFLFYTNELEVEGLIASAGSFANIARKKNILDLLAIYDRVAGNLRRHDPRYPTADQLRAVTWQGRDGTWGTPDFGATDQSLDRILGEGKDSEASDAIIRIVDRPDSRPVWFCSWGGSREVAQAIWKVRATRPPAELARFVSRLRLYLIARQDLTTQWMLDTFPDLFVILSRQSYQGMFWNAPGADRTIADLSWTNAHLREGHGPLAAVYPRSGWDPTVPGQWEGDTPSYLHLLGAVRGLNDPEQPAQGGWGGRFVRSNPDCNHWTDDPSGTVAVSRWRAHYQDEWADRVDWSLATHTNTPNRRPILELNGDRTTQPLALTVRPGEMLTLSAEGSSDPDGDAIAVAWSVEADAADTPAALSSTTGPTTRLLVPEGAPAQTVQVVLQVHDLGTPNLWAYRRALVHIQP